MFFEVAQLLGAKIKLYCALKAYVINVLALKMWQWQCAIMWPDRSQKIWQSLTLNRKQ